MKNLWIEWLLQQRRKERGKGGREGNDLVTQITGHSFSSLQ